MIILYILFIAYILAVNFYAFTLVKTFQAQDKEEELRRQGEPLTRLDTSATPPQKYLGKLLVTGLIGGAIAIYVCMFIYKWKRTDLLLMVVMPLLGVLNVYIWVLLFRSGFSFFLIR